MGERLVAPDVVDESGATGLMELAVVVEADHRLVPPHVEERVVGAVVDVDLGARPWKSLVDDEQSQRRLLRGLRRPSGPARGCSGFCHVRGDSGRPAQARRLLRCRSPRERIEMAHCEVAVEVTSEVERGSRPVRHGHPVDQDQLLIADQLVACEDPTGWSGRGCDEFDGRARVDPERTMECGRPVRRRWHVDPTRARHPPYAAAAMARRRRGRRRRGRGMCNSTAVGCG